MILSDMLSNMIGQMLGEIFGETLETKLERRAMLRAVSAAVARAEQQFAHTYRPHDPELVDVLTTQTRFADLPSVQAALRALLTRPLDDAAPQVTALRRSFDDVLPQRLDRERVDAALQAFLDLLGREVLYIPQLQDLYALGYQRRTAEHTRRLAEQATTIAEGISALRTDMRQLAALPAPQPQGLIAPPPLERSRPWHNLPQRNYTQFIGRQAELEQLHRLLLPHPRSRIFVVTLDGIGGVGKSALALELAHQYRERYDTLPPDERFEAIVWASAKRTLLTTQGIQQRRPNFGTLDDLFREIAYVLDQPAVLQAEPAQRGAVAERALSAQRTLLIVDNLETVDDEELLSFLRELPDPTKAIVTTRHRIDIAYAIRITGMPREDALALMEVEAASRGVNLPPAARDDLFRRGGGVPLAIVWSIGLMSVGHSVEAVLRRLGSGQSDIARFCFAESVAHIRGHDAERLLLALALFEHSVSRTMLGAVAGLGDDVVGRDDGLVELLRLSLANQRGDRFKLLPLTQSFALEALAKQPELERGLREQWMRVLVDFAQPYQQFHLFQPSPHALIKDGKHLTSFAHWTRQQERPDLFLAVLPALLYYMDTMGYWSDLLTVASQGLEYAHLLNQEQETPRIYCTLAWVLSQQGRHDAAEQALQTALDTARRLRDLAWEVEVLGRFAQVTRRHGDLSRAATYCQQAWTLGDTLPAHLLPFVRADLDHELGKLARDRGDWAEAARLFNQVQQVFPTDTDQPAFNPERAWGVLGNIAYVRAQLNDLDEAANLYERCLAFYRQAGGRGYLATTLVRLAALEIQRGNQAVALTYAREALEWSRKLGLVQEQAQAEELMARLEPEIGR